MIIPETILTDPEPALITVDDVVFVLPRVRELAPAPVAIATVFPPVELARLMVCAPVPPNRVAVPVFAAVDPRLNVPEV